jgi:glycosyltransferase involved in cell wall biosynthesis
MELLVSVIVPIYNARSYLPKCLESLLRQTYSSYELILVDDGSTDDSYDVCLEYSKSHPRIRLIRQPNKGVSAARNLGLEKALGEYICFVDADDVVSDIYIEELVDLLVSQHSDVAILSFTKRSDGLVWSYTPTTRKRPNEVLWNQEEALFSYITKRQFESSVWAKLFRRDVLTGVRFEEGLRIAEDKLFVFEALVSCERIAFLDRPLYYYHQRNDSVMNASFDEKNMDDKLVVDNIYIGLSIIYPHLERMLYKEKMATYCRIIQKTFTVNTDYAISSRYQLRMEVKKCNIFSILPFCRLKDLWRLLGAKYCPVMLGLYERLKTIRIGSGAYESQKTEHQYDN